MSPLASPPDAPRLAPPRSCHRSPRRPTRLGSHRHAHVTARLAARRVSARTASMDFTDRLVWGSHNFECYARLPTGGAQPARVARLALFRINRLGSQLTGPSPFGLLASQRYQAQTRSKR